MKCSPVILQSVNDKGQVPKRIESRAGDVKDEHWLQELIYRHPDLIPIDAFDEFYSPPIPVGRELSTSSGPLDNLYFSPKGGLTIVETKLWKNPEKHRTVVAQVIDYAKELATWTYDDLQNAVIASSRQRKEPLLKLDDKVSPFLAGPIHEFQESVLRNLKEGNFLLLIVGDRISPNLLMLTKSIQSAPGLGFTMGLVELQMFSVGNAEWPLLVVPEIVGRTVEVTRGIIKVAYSQEKPKIEVSVEDETDSSRENISLEWFLNEIPADLREPYKNGADEWAKVGSLGFGTSGISWKVRLGPGKTSLMYTYPTHGIALVRKQDFAKWSDNQEIYSKYLQNLEESAVVTNTVREGKQYLKHEKITASDLRVILKATLGLATDLANQD